MMITFLNLLTIIYLLGFHEFKNIDICYLKQEIGC